MTTNVDNVDSPKKKSKAPPEWPTYAVKCSWDATAMTIKVKAKDEADAKERAWKQVARMDGGMYCLNVVVKGVVN